MEDVCFTRSRWFVLYTMCLIQCSAFPTRSWLMPTLLFTDHTFRTSGLCCPRAFFVFTKGCGSSNLTRSWQRFDLLDLVTLQEISVLTSQGHQQSGWPSCRASVPEACPPLPSTQWDEKTQPSRFCPPASTDVAQQQRLPRWVLPALIDDTRQD